MKFEWDVEKAALNLQKHKVDFTDAALDTAREQDGEVYRLISARKADAYERKQYGFI